MNDDFNILLLDQNGNEIGYTNKKIASELIKSNEGEYIDKKSLSLNKISVNTKNKVNTKKGLNKIQIPIYSLSEELLNSISHGLGALLSIAILVLCVIFSVLHNNVYAVISSSIYGGTSILLYLMSTLYHAFKVGKTKKVFRIIDHCSIYLLIAGTYTPYALVTLRQSSLALGWSVFGIIWGCAILGITLTSIDMNKFKKFGLVLYLIMGWMIIFTFKTLLKAIPLIGIILMLIAGIVYSIGAILYVIGKKKKYMHSVFHFFVVIASLFFFFSIFFYVI